MSFCTGCSNTNAFFNNLAGVDDECSIPETSKTLRPETRAAIRSVSSERYVVGHVTCVCVPCLDLCGVRMFEGTRTG